MHLYIHPENYTGKEEKIITAIITGVSRNVVLKITVFSCSLKMKGTGFYISGYLVVIIFIDVHTGCLLCIWFPLVVNSNRWYSFLDNYLTLHDKDQQHQAIILSLFMGTNNA